MFTPNQRKHDPCLSRQSWPFIGRDDTLTELLSLVKQSRPGVLIMGSVGVGKTRLAREVLAGAVAWRGHVRRASASESAARISFGALAHLLPATLPTANGHANLLRILADALLADAGDEQILFVDDVHLLDDSSAALVLHLAVRGGVQLVLTARSVMPMPDAIEALVRGSYVTRVDLRPLGPDAVSHLLERTLRGQVQTATAHRLWKSSGGNVLWLQQLVDAGLASGALTMVDEVWRWHGPFQFSTHLVDLVSAHIGRLSPAMQRAAELLAVGEPLGEEIFEQLTSPAVLDELDARHLVISDEDGRRAQVRLAHPLYGEVLRQQMPVHRRRRYCRDLASAVRQTGMCRREDVTRVAGWRLDAGDLTDPQLFLAAAHQAILTMDFTLATRLAQAACDAGGGAPARRTLAIALGHAGHGAHAEQVNSGLPNSITPDRDELRSVQMRAVNLALSLDRPADAVELLRRTEQAMTETAACNELAALQAVLLATQADWPTCAQAIARVQRYPSSDPYTTVLVRYAESVDHFYHGRTRAAVRTIQSALSIWPEDDLPLANIGLLSWLCNAQAYSDQLDQADATATAQYRQARDSRWEATEGVWQLYLGRITARRGRLRTAQRHMREASSLLRNNSTWGQHALVLGEWATVEALLGDATQAQLLLDQAQLARVEANRGIHILTFRMAQPWILAAQGRLRDAERHAIRAASDARQQQTLLWEAELLHLPVRLGRPAAVTARLTTLVAATDAPHINTYATHANALHTRNAPAMEEVCSAFDAAGMRLHAAETAAQAAHLWSLNGNTQRARRAADRCHQLVQHCQGAMTPAILTCRTPALTDRERHIARLAAGGHSSRHIAMQLGITPRTVDNHLHRIYNKTGIRNRRELPTILTISSDQSQP